jgi:hypothetical protein
MGVVNACGVEDLTVPVLVCALMAADCAEMSVAVRIARGGARVSTPSFWCRTYVSTVRLGPSSPTQIDARIAEAVESAH